MGLLLWMVECNLPLYKWKDYQQDYNNRVYYPGWSNKKIDQVARIITNSCSNDAVVELLAKEWDSLPSLMRMSLTHEMNEALGTRSNNKTKGIRRLDVLLGGRVLRSEDNNPTDRKLISMDGKVIAVDKKLNPAVLGGERSHAAYALPANYDSLTPAEKRKLREKLAKERRESKE